MTPEQTEACEKIIPDWALKAGRERKLIKDSLQYWKDDVKDNVYYTDEEKVIFVIMDVIGRLNEQLAAQTPEMLLLNPLVKGLVENVKEIAMQAHYKQEEYEPWEIQEDVVKALAPFKEGV